MSKISELAENFARSASEQQKAINESVKSAMQTHLASIEADLQKLQKEIERNTQETLSEVNGQLARIKNALRRRTLLLAILLPVLIWLTFIVLTLWETHHLRNLEMEIVENEKKLIFQKEQGAKFNTTTCQWQGKTYPCVEVRKTKESWKNETIEGKNTEYRLLPKK